MNLKWTIGGLLAILMLLGACQSKNNRLDNTTYMAYDKALQDTIAMQLIAYTEGYKYQEQKKDDHSMAYAPEEAALRFFRKRADSLQIQQYQIAADSLHAFMFTINDRKSILGRYRAIGGYYKLGADSLLKDVAIKFYTPRLTPEEAVEKGTLLFEEMTTTGNVYRFLEERQIMEFPNKDVVYDSIQHTWVYQIDTLKALVRAER
ncbi:hypothetical protein [Algivirga pacifica]|uniref:DUF4919 domain-containing protein n=1 Tax=Algivirga pacifica TaxID=1162670 RepID=A0ABP9DM94_9BACT